MKKGVVCVLGLLTLLVVFSFTPSDQSVSLAQEDQGPLLLVYSDIDFKGECLEITGDVIDLPVIIDAEGNEFDWNDKISSIRVVSGTWRIFQHGRANTLLDDDNPPQEFDVRSKRAIDGWTCLLSAHSQGSVEYPTPASGGFANDAISSIQLVLEDNLPDWAVLQPRATISAR